VPFEPEEKSRHFVTPTPYASSNPQPEHIEADDVGRQRDVDRATPELLQTRCKQERSR
jgi:hypothetical protein